jgi:hypothetical protein
MKKAILLAIVFAIVGRLAWPRLFPLSASESFVVKQLESQMKSGFAEISPDWKEFLKEWEDSSVKARHRAGSRAIVDYASFAELATVYRMRAQLYVYIAKDKKLNGICDGRVSDDAVVALLDEITPFVPIAGRSLARMYVGEPAFKPPIDFAKEGAWIELAMYLNRIGKGDILTGLQALGSRKGATPEQMCMTMGSLYSLAGNRPADMMSSVSIMDFVRSVESYVLKD